MRFGESHGSLDDRVAELEAGERESGTVVGPGASLAVVGTVSRVPDVSAWLPGGDAGVSARDRIGKGPWTNAKGVVIAKNLDDLHSDHNNLTKQTALSEK